MSVHLQGTRNEYSTEDVRRFYFGSAYRPLFPCEEKGIQIILLLKDNISHFHNGWEKNRFAVQTGEGFLYICMKGPDGTVLQLRFQVPTTFKIFCPKK